MATVTIKIKDTKDDDGEETVSLEVELDPPVQITETQILTAAQQVGLDVGEYVRKKFGNAGTVAAIDGSGESHTTDCAVWSDDQAACSCGADGVRHG